MKKVEKVKEKKKKGRREVEVEVSSCRGKSRYLFARSSRHEVMFLQFFNELVLQEEESK